MYRPPKIGEMRTFAHCNCGKGQEKYFCLQGKKDCIFLIQLGNAQKACVSTDSVHTSSTWEKPAKIYEFLKDFCTILTVS